MATKGIKEVDLFFQNLSKKVDKIAAKTLIDRGKSILEVSKMLAPVDTGRMIRDTEVVVVSDTEVQVRYNADYSLYVHEDLEAQHPNGGQAKFLEIATNMEGQKVSRKIARDIGKIRGNR